MKPINDSDLEQVSAFIDGELSDSERRFFQKRLCNDAELRAYCERAWIASSVLKSQPFQLMPANSAEKIFAQCDDSPVTERFKWPLRLVASFGALALVAGLGLQLMKPSAPTNVEVVKNTESTAMPAVIESSQSVADARKPENAVAGPKPVNASAKRKPVANAQQVALDNPSQFELNEATRSKSWPTSNQGMDEYLTRHNQMIGSNANNGLVSYAQILTEPTEGSEQQDALESPQDNK